MSISLCELNRTKEGFLDYSSVELEEWHLTHEDNPAFDFEIIDWQSWGRFMETYWYYPLYAGVIYLVGIFGIQHYMKDRKPFDLKRELFWWNLGLGIFSFFGFIRSLPDFLYILDQPNGFFKSVCNIQFVSKQFPFWSVAFILSKYVELGDTFFIVLRKRPLQLLQWYHHLITLVVCWITGPFIEPIGRHFSLMNYGVHSLMYPYFAMRAMDLRVPSQVANVITTLQLTQMIMGLFVNLYSAYFFYFSSTACYRQPLSIKLFFGVYGSFAILFGDLFYKLVVQKYTLKKVQ